MTVCIYLVWTNLQNGWETERGGGVEGSGGGGWQAVSAESDAHADDGNI